MGKGKGFARRKPDLSVAPTVDRLEQIATTVPRLEVLLTAIIERKLSPRCYGMIKRLAHTAPVFRLIMNLKACLGQLCVKDIENVLQDGLSKDEREVLIELDASAMSLEARRTAHSLLNIEARIKLVTAFGGVFRDMRTRKNHILVGKPLDD